MPDLQTRRAAAAAAADPVYKERQAEIHAAAARVFLRKGFHATKLSDVAEETGLDRASLYYYVGSKRDLFHDVVDKAVTANIADAELVAARDMPSSEKLTQIIESLMSSFERFYPDLYVFVQEDVQKMNRGGGTDDDAVATMRKEWSDRYFTIVKKVVSEGIANGEFATRLPPGLVAHSLIGMMISSHRWFQPNGMLSAEEIGVGMARMVMSGLRA
jgi:AcrR family transcriptional regulator